MPRKSSEPNNCGLRGERTPLKDRKSFDDWWSQRYFFSSHPLYDIYKKIYLKGADLDFIDCLKQCLLFADSLDAWRREAGGRRRSESLPTKGKLRKSIQRISSFIWDCVNFSRQQGRKENFSPGMKETLQAHLLINYATNPEDFRSGGKSDRNGSFFLLVVTEHFRENEVKPRYLLAARLLRKIRGQRSVPAHLEATRAKIRIDQFKRLTPDWELRLREFTKNLRYLATT